MLQTVFLTGDDKGQPWPQAAGPLWKSATTFGFVRLQVGLRTARFERDLDFDGLEKRRTDPVGYTCIHKKTGKENIVKASSARTASTS